MDDSVNVQLWLDGAVDSAAAVVSTWGLRVLGALAVLVLGWMVAKIVRATARRALARVNIDATLVPFLSGIAYYLVIMVVLVAALSLVGIQTGSLIALLGAAGLAVGLALQGTLSHFASGVMLLSFRPIRAGDFVDIGGTSGTVHQVGLFAVALDTPDNVRIVVPNSNVWGQTITNYAVNDQRRIDLVIGVGYEDDLQLAARVIAEVLAEDDRVLEQPEPQVAVSELADSSVNFVVRPWCRREDYWDLRFALIERIKARLEAAGCSIPFPQRDVHVHQMT